MRLPRLRRIAAFAVVVPAFALATSIVERPLAERARSADRVVLAQVLESQTVVLELVPPKVEGGRPTPRMITVTRVAVGSDYKGAGPSQLEVVQLGGRYGLWEAHVPGDATFAPGETAILLLRCRENAAGSRCTLLGLGGGKLQVLGDQVLVRSLARGEQTRRPLSAVIDELRQAAKVSP
ncbi:MAG: hypothetical protein ACYC8T_32120 [Myxococcaceae bacterium]